MKLIDAVCPHCGGTLKISADEQSCTCEYCNAKLVLDNETLHIQLNNAEESGYLFEKGMQRAKAESYGNTSPSISSDKPCPNKKSRIWLWVLGWIFVFPLPLTILMIRNERLDKKIRYGIIIVAWALYLMIGFLGGKGENSNKSYKSENNNSASTIGSQINETTDTATVQEDETAVFADDVVVNKFITEFNNSALFDIIDISRGNIRTKYFGYANNRYLEMINSNNSAAEIFILKINGGQTEKDNQEMFDVFKEAIKVFDNTISEEEINNTIMEMKEKNVLSDCKIGKHITLTYVPTVELSHGENTSRIDISVDNYK